VFGSRVRPEDLTMNVQDVTPILNVSNLDESFAWFERLGWKKHWEHGDPPTFGAVLSGTSEIFLCRGGQGARGGPMPREAWDNQAGSTWMTWWLHSSADVDEVYALALRLGIVAPWPPTDMPWNVRECHIRHPDGHMIRVSARLEDE
jgi:catechol 2,3-dioxygenase-like lactoylglutathione lyase family enzyme